MNFDEITPLKIAQEQDGLMEQEGRLFWESCIEEFKKKVTPQVLKAWLNPITAKGYNPNTRVLHLVFPTNAKAAYFDDNYRDVVCSMASLKWEVRVKIKNHVENNKLNKDVISFKTEVALSQPKLPFWDESVRARPNLLVRSAFITCSNKRVHYKKLHPIASYKNQQFSFMGETLTVSDGEVLDLLIHLAREQPLGDHVEFTAHSFLKTLGRGSKNKLGESDYENLREQFNRLVGATIEIKLINEKFTYTGHLIDSLYKDDNTGRYVVVFGQKLLGLFDNGYTKIDYERKAMLGRANLAKWLYDFYSSHAKPYSIKVETLLELSGSEASVKSFKQKLKIGLSKIQECGLIKEFTINDATNLVYVEKQVTAKRL
jgi:hypothetical protein